MCLQCSAQTIDYGEFAPGWYLVRATRTVEDEMQEGQWGLVRVNDPDVIFTSPLRLPENQEDLVSLVEQFSDQLYLRAQTGYNLYKAVKEVKFPFAVKRLWVKNDYSYSFEAQLYLYLAWFVSVNTFNKTD